MLRFLFCCLVLLLPLQAVSQTALSQKSGASNSGHDPWSDCRPTSSCRINAKTLSEQESDPFLFLGRVIDSESARWRHYRKALNRFPDARACLMDRERVNDAPNLLLIDWDRVGTGRGAEVCVFRITRSFDQSSDVEKWLRFHSFEFRGRSRRFSATYEPQFRNEPITGITAAWSNEKYRSLNPNWFSRLTGFEWLSGYQLVIDFNSENEVVSVGVVTPSK